MSAVVAELEPRRVTSADLDEYERLYEYWKASEEEEKERRRRYGDHFLETLVRGLVLGSEEGEFSVKPFRGGFLTVTYYVYAGEYQLDYFGCDHHEFMQAGERLRFPTAVLDRTWSSIKAMEREHDEAAAQLGISRYVNDTRKGDFEAITDHVALNREKADPKARRKKDGRRRLSRSAPKSIIEFSRTPFSAEAPR